MKLSISHKDNCPAIATDPLTPGECTCKQWNLLNKEQRKTYDSKLRFLKNMKEDIKK